RCARAGRWPAWRRGACGRAPASGVRWAGRRCRDTAPAAGSRRRRPRSRTPWAAGGPVRTGRTDGRRARARQTYERYGGSLRGLPMAGPLSPGAMVTPAPPAFSPEPRAGPGRRAARTPCRGPAQGPTARIRAPSASTAPAQGSVMTSTAELSSPASAGTGLTRGVTDPDYSLEDRYARTRGRIYLSGVQALVRLPIMQRLRDQAASLDTAGFVSGYRGTLVGGCVLGLWCAGSQCGAAKVRFRRGINGDHGASWVWGT